jgi:hypothetical protein
MFYDEGVLFRRDSAPDVPEPIRVGDLWADTSQNQLNILTATSPSAVWTPIVGGGGAGTVTSVGLALPAMFTVTNSPVTTSGTLTAAYASQTANQLFAAPSGSSGTPTFRALAAADIGNAALAVGGNAATGTITVGTTTDQTLNLTAGSSISPSITIFGATTAGKGDVYLNPRTGNNIVISAEVDHTADSYSMGMPTANGYKAFTESLTGTLQNAFGVAKANASTDYVLAFSTSANTGSTWTRAFGVRQDGCIGVQAGIVNCNTAPTISSGFGTTPSIASNNGTFTFRVNVGSGATATSGVIGLPTATTGWNCVVQDSTTAAKETRVTASTTASVTVTAASAWGANDILIFICMAY